MVTAAAWLCLASAVEHLPHDTPCAGDERFTGTDESDDDELARLCVLCPIKRACFEAGSLALTGFWGGRRRRPPKYNNDRKE